MIRLEIGEAYIIDDHEYPDMSGIYCYIGDTRIGGARDADNDSARFESLPHKGQITIGYTILDEMLLNNRIKKAAEADLAKVLLLV
jgi:hypothetical protein